MATSTFFTSFKTGPGAKLEGYSGHIYLVPSGSAVNGDMPLTEDTGRPGQYFRENVPDGEYKVYVDLDKSGSPVEGDLYKIPGSGNPYLVWHGESKISKISGNCDTDGKMKLTGLKLLHLENQTGDSTETELTHDISASSFTDPKVILINKSEYPVYVKSISSTEIVIGVASYGSGAIKYDLLIIEN